MTIPTFVSFSGPQSAGKTTTAERLVEHIKSLKKKVKYIEEPFRRINPDDFKTPLDMQNKLIDMFHTELMKAVKDGVDYIVADRHYIDHMFYAAIYIEDEETLISHYKDIELFVDEMLENVNSVPFVLKSPKFVDDGVRKEELYPIEKATFRMLSSLNYENCTIIKEQPLDDVFKDVVKTLKL